MASESDRSPQKASLKTKGGPESSQFAYYDFSVAVFSLENRLKSLKLFLVNYLFFFIHRAPAF